MVNYGYECKGWTIEQMEVLAARLWILLEKYPKPVQKIPSVEINGLYSGVRIRGITHIGNENQESLVLEADQIFRDTAEELGIRIKKRKN